MKNKTHSCIKCKREFYISNWNQHLEWHDRQEEKSKMPPKKKDYTERKWVTKMLREMFLEEFELSVSQRPIPKNGRKWCSILNRSWPDKCECERLEQGWTLKEYKEILKERKREIEEVQEIYALWDVDGGELRRTGLFTGLPDLHPCR